MRNLTATLCLTIAVLLGSVEMSWGDDSEKDYATGAFAYDRGDYATSLLRATRKDPVFTITQQATASKCSWGVGKVRRIIDALISLDMLEVVWKDQGNGWKQSTKYRLKHAKL